MLHIKSLVLFFKTQVEEVLKMMEIELGSGWVISTSHFCALVNTNSSSSRQALEVQFKSNQSRMYVVALENRCWVLRHGKSIPNERAVTEHQKRPRHTYDSKIKPFAIQPWINSEENVGNLLMKVLDEGMNHLVFITYRLSIATIFVGSIGYFRERLGFIIVFLSFCHCGIHGWSCS
ncbi:nodulin MtN21 /EamA transporter family protein [Trifolium repens]|nr:nodulin MtN21 /EamA transporter family protein [Trifolium repens]KAK2413913.1 nodulin MtN21 /EamA transporter family protein [Trifolium repens]KAK2416608.1 nodulin MtN21 /EamA transporter family protein [Trifolium repens]